MDSGKCHILGLSPGRRYTCAENTYYWCNKIGMIVNTEVGYDVCEDIVIGPLKVARSVCLQ